MLFLVYAVQTDVSAEGVSLGMEDSENLVQSQNNNGVEEALEEYKYNLIVPQITNSLHTAFWNGTAPLPGFLNYPAIVHVNEITSSDTLSPNTIYLVDNVADLGDSKTIRNIAVIASKEIKIGSNTNTYDIVLVSPMKILVGSYNTLGAINYCDFGKFSVYMFSGENIEFGSNNYLRGVQMGSLNEIKLGTDIMGVEGVHAEAVGNFDYGSSDTYGGCANQLTSTYVNPSFSQDVEFSEVALVR